MKKKLFTISILTITFWSFATDSSCALIGNRVQASIVPPIIIRPPVNKQKIVYYDILFRDKSTFVDISFEA